jgi:hypothetical protein
MVSLILELRLNFLLSHHKVLIEFAHCTLLCVETHEFIDLK